MLRILTLGGLSVESSGKPLATSHIRPQGLGLLARLAVAGERGLSREKLVGYFWPEKDERTALHSLSQALHRLRHDLGSGEILLGTRILRLDTRYVSSDVGDLEVAQRAGHAKRVAELYAGPFLDGIFFSGVPDLERWIEAERKRLADTFASALRKLAHAAAAVGQHADAAQWWGRLSETDPLDGPVALELVKALAACGDRAGAVREARRHQALVRTELLIEPDARFAELVARYERGTRDARDPASTPTTSRERAQSDATGFTTEVLCARARQRFYTFTREGFDEAIRHAERAVQLAPEHAEAHATLGSVCVALSQGEPSGNLRARGVSHLRRAAEIDPRLSEAYLWLAWAEHLDERFERSEVLALQGVELDPGGLMSHSVLAWSRLVAGLKTGNWEKCVSSVASFTRALAIHPRDPNMLMALGSLYMVAGQYDHAHTALARAVETERWAPHEMRTIGALTLDGLVELHAGRPASARERLAAAHAAYAGAPQIYAPYVEALTLCGLGDLERLEGRYDEALAHYVRAREALESRPALIGCGYLVVRLETRLAGVYQRLRMRHEEAAHAREAAALTLTRERYCFNWCWGTSEAELHYDWAVHHATCADLDAMAGALRLATSLGWGEFSQFAAEPAFAEYRHHPALVQLTHEGSGRPPLPPPSSSEQALPTPRDSEPARA